MWRAGRGWGPEYSHPLPGLPRPLVFQTHRLHILILDRRPIPDDPDDPHGPKHVSPMLNGRPGRKGPSSLPVLDDGRSGRLRRTRPHSRTVEGHSPPGPCQGAPARRVHLHGRAGGGCEARDVLGEPGQAFSPLAPCPKSLYDARIGGKALGASVELRSEGRELVLNRGERRLDDRLLPRLCVGLDEPNGIPPNSHRREESHDESDANPPRPRALSQTTKQAVHRAQARRQVHGGSGALGSDPLRRVASRRGVSRSAQSRREGPLLGSTFDTNLA